MMRLLVFLLFLFVIPAAQAQKEDVLDRILVDFSLYSELPREVAYVHLNKSVFIKGEDLGFKAYVMDKDHKRPSQETENLYCILSDSSGQVVKSQLIRIQDGVGKGVFTLDSLFQTGRYTLKAYTNWMRNFSEANYYQQSFEVLNPETHSSIPLKALPVDLEAQFLPEGGHAVAGLSSVFGIIIKDTDGYGVPDLEGTITDAAGREVTTFRLNQFGIGRMEFIPRKGSVYYAHFRYLNRQYKIPLPPAEPEGVSLRLTDLRDKVGIALSTRFNDRERTDAPFYLTVHNGDSIKGVPVSFREGAQQVKIFPKSELYSGINVFTLFGPEGEPLLERLFFNDLGMVFRDSMSGYGSQEKDSLKIQLGISGLRPENFNSLSVSILPKGTKAYRGHHNLPSYTLLQPYVNGPIQNAWYYFQDISAKKRYELDNLLLTQGWSSYDWNTVSNYPPAYRFDFERGIAYTVGFNSRKSDAFYIFPTYNNTSHLLELNPGQEHFTVENFYPLEGEKLSITEIRGNSKSRPSGAYVHFKPSAIPPLKSEKAKILHSRLGRQYQEISVPPISFENLKKIQILDEVTVTEERRISRLQQLQDRTPGRIDIFAINDPRRNMWLSTYLSGRGFVVNEGLGTLDIEFRNPNSPNSREPVIYLDGVMLTDFDILWRFPLDIVDYIEINPTGIGSGLMGGRGVIRIVTDPTLRRESFEPPAFQSYEVPLAFGNNKQFYTPVYSSYTDEFFEAFGTLGWEPDLRADSEGVISFYTQDHGLEDLVLQVEGIVNGNEFVSCRVPLVTKAK